MKQTVLSFPEVLLQRAEREPEKIAYRFFRGSTLSSETLTFHALWEQAAALACLMQRDGLSNERALLVCKSQKHFVVGFCACLLAGTVADAVWADDAAKATLPQMRPIALTASP